VDHKRSEQLGDQRLGDLDPSVGEVLVDTLRRQEIERLRKQRLPDLDEKQHQIAREFLREKGLALDEGQMRSLRRQTLRDLDPEAYHDLLHDIGKQMVAGWSTSRFRDLEGEQQAVVSAYLGRRIMAQIERRILLHTISRLWMDYLTDIEDLRRGIGLEAYGQRDPLIEYKRRAYELFEELGDNIRRTVIRSIFRQPPASLVEQRTS
jgi:preprotein translocase subunit SecA